MRLFLNRGTRPFVAGDRWFSSPATGMLLRVAIGVVRRTHSDRTDLMLGRHRIWLGPTRYNVVTWLRRDGWTTVLLDDVSRPVEIGVEDWSRIEEFLEHREAKFAGDFAHFFWGF